MAMNEEEVNRRTLLYEMEDELWRLVKRRGWILAIVFTVIGVGGIWAIVHYTVQQVAGGPLKDLQKQLVLAEVQADGAKSAAAASRTAADQVTTSLATLQQGIETLRGEANAVRDQFSHVSQQINAASANAARRSQRDFNALQQRIGALEALVKQIGEENDATRKATADHAKQVAALTAKFEREQKRFAENSEYTVSITFPPSKKAIASEVQTRLAALGFRTPINELPEKLPEKMLQANSLLLYRDQSEAKAQEVLALLKPVLRNVQARKLPDLERTPADTAEFPTKIYEFKKPGVSFFSMLTWVSLGPKSMQLSLGTD